MRRALFALACLAPTLGACASRGAEDSKMVTTAEANRSGLGGAVQAPLRDVNIIRTKIPQVLLDAMADPYARPPNTDCQSLAALIRPLDETLGEDLDLLPPKDDEDLIDRGKGLAADSALGAIAGAASDLIPMRGWVRKLTGAEKHDNLVQAAAAAGSVRRGYLKGLGEARGCDPPATPDHTRSTLPHEPKRSGGPRYPTRLPPGASLPGGEVAPEGVQPPTGDRFP